MADQDTLPVDATIMDEYFSNSYEYAQAIFDIVISTVIPEALEVIKTGNDMPREDLRRAVHKMKPSFKMTGFSIIFDEMNRTEELCMSDVPQAEIADKLNKLKILINDCEVILKKQLKYIELQLNQA